MAIPLFNLREYILMYAGRFNFVNRHLPLRADRNHPGDLRLGETAIPRLLLPHGQTLHQSLRRKFTKHSNTLPFYG